MVKACHKLNIPIQTKETEKRFQKQIYTVIKEIVSFLVTGQWPFP